MRDRNVLRHAEAEEADGSKGAALALERGELGKRGMGRGMGELVIKGGGPLVLVSLFPAASRDKMGVVIRGSGCSA